MIALNACEVATVVEKADPAAASTEQPASPPIYPKRKKGSSPVEKGSPLNPPPKDRRKQRYLVEKVPTPEAEWDWVYHTLKVDENRTVVVYGNRLELWSWEGGKVVVKKLQNPSYQPLPSCWDARRCWIYPESSVMVVHDSRKRPYFVFAGGYYDNGNHISKTIGILDLDREEWTLKELSRPRYNVFIHQNGKQLYFMGAAFSPKTGGFETS